jgi:hypothetical protein
MKGLFYPKQWQTAGGVLTAALLVLALTPWMAGAADPGTDAPPGPIEEVFESGRIDWSTGTIVTAGSKPLPDKTSNGEATRQKAMAMARVAAQQRLLETVNQVRIDSDTSVGSVTAEDNVIAAELGEMVRKQADTRPEFLSDGTVTVNLSLAMHGAFSQLLLPAELKQIETIRPLDAENKTPAADAPTATEPLSTAEMDVFTGLVVDARGLLVKPAMMPTISNEEHQVLFGAATASREYAVQRGMSGFTTDMATAQADQRIGSRPLVVKALRVNGPELSGLVISNSDAAVLRSEPHHLTFLKQCRVIIVLDPPTPIEPAPKSKG